MSKPGERRSMRVRLGKKSSPQAPWNRKMEMQGERKTAKPWNDNRHDCAYSQAAETNEVEKWRIWKENKNPVTMCVWRGEGGISCKSWNKCFLVLITLRINNVWFFLLGNWPAMSTQKKVRKKKYRPRNFVLIVVVLAISVSTCPLIHLLSISQTPSCLFLRWTVK